MGSNLNRGGTLGRYLRTGGIIGRAQMKETCKMTKKLSHENEAFADQVSMTS